jgi:hypothetical protein
MERSDLDEVNDLLDEWFRGEGAGKISNLLALVQRRGAGKVNSRMALVPRRGAGKVNSRMALVLRRG